MDKLYVVSSNNGNARRPRGRPRSERARQSVLDADEDLALAHDGVATIEEIAGRAGVSRTTVYKWWKSPGAVMLEGLEERIHETDDHQQTPTDPYDGLLHQMESLNRLLMHTQAGALFRRLMTTTGTDPAVREALLERWIRPRRKRAAEIIRQGMLDKSLRDDLDVELVIDGLFAPIYHRLTVAHLPLDTELPRRLLDTVWPGITVHHRAKADR